MQRVPRILFAVAPVALVLAACGGGAAAPTAAVPTSGAGATAGAAATAGTPGGAPTAAASAQPPSAPAATQATVTLDLCKLLTANELSSVLGGSWAEGQLTATGGYCHWDSGTGPNDQTIAAIDPRTLDTIKGLAAGGTDMTVAGRPAYSVRSAATHLQTTYVDVGGTVLILEFGTSSSAADDQAHAQALADLVLGKL